MEPGLKEKKVKNLETVDKFKSLSKDYEIG